MQSHRMSGPSGEARTLFHPSATVHLPCRIPPRHRSRPRKCASGEPSRIPKTGTPKNKLRNHGASFEAKELTAKTPRFTTQPPRLHHQKTTIKHPFFAKTPAKHHKLHPEKIFDLPHRIRPPDPTGQGEFRTVRQDDENRSTLKWKQSAGDHASITA
jgi:hypothetical protein